MPIILDDYYSRAADHISKGYRRLLFRATRGAQSAEVNELQEIINGRIKGIASAIWSDGSVIEGAQPLVDSATGLTSCPESTIYIDGEVWTVPARVFTIPTSGVVLIGVYLETSVVTEIEDETLKGPATGTVAHNQPGAARLSIVPRWAHDGEGVTPFYPVYTIIDGVLFDGSEPLNSAWLNLLARYDREANGSYTVRGLNVRALTADGEVMVGAGVGNVWGYKRDKFTDTRLNYPPSPDLEAVISEPDTYVDAATPIALNRKPVQAISAVVGTKETTEVITRGGAAGGIDALGQVSVTEIVSVTQDPTTYDETADWVLDGDSIDWSPGGAEPSPGSTYSVTYRYLSTFTPADVDLEAGTFTVAGAVAGELILTDYTWRVPRYDRICLQQDGTFLRLKGQANRFQPVPPPVPDTVLHLATIHQTWSYINPPALRNDGPRTVTMLEQQNIRELMIDLFDLVSRERLEREISSREPTTKRGVLVDPCGDDLIRDAGLPQTARIARGGLRLPVNMHPVGLEQNNDEHWLLPYTEGIVLDQSLETGITKINPYGAITIGAPPVDPTEPTAPTVGAALTITPSADHVLTSTRFRWLQTDGIEDLEENGLDLEEFRQLALATGVYTSFEAYVDIKDNVRVNASWRGGDKDKTSITEKGGATWLVADRVEDPFCRELDIAFSIVGFGAGETLGELLFDGVDVTPAGALTANGSGEITGSFTIPAGVPFGPKLVEATGGSGSYCTAQYSATVANTGADFNSRPYKDPVAQTFRLEQGRWITSIDLAFRVAGDTTKPVQVQIRQTTVGFANEVVIAQASTPGTFATTGWTNIVFPEPVWLEALTEYAVTLLTADNNHSVALAELGEVDINTGQQVTEQASAGVLLKSANASTWSAFQTEDLTFRLYAADFTANTREVDYGYVHSIQPSAITSTGGVATVTAVGHRLASGDVVVVANADQSEYNGSFTVTVVDADEFTYPISGTPASPATGAVFIAPGRISDLQVRGRVIQPTANCGVVFKLTLDNVATTEQLFAHAEHLELDYRILHGARLSVLLAGTPTESPLIGRDLAVALGDMQESGTYITRAMPVAVNDRVEINYDGFVPSTASVTVDLDAAALASPSITSAGGTATVVATAHGRTTGDIVRVGGCEQAEYNGTFEITVTDVDTFTYPITGTPVSPATGTPQVVPYEPVPFNEITQDLGDGWSDFNYSDTDFDVAGTETRLRLTLNGTPAARPLLNNIRMAALTV